MGRTSWVIFTAAFAAGLGIGFIVGNGLKGPGAGGEPVLLEEGGPPEATGTVTERSEPAAQPPERTAVPEPAPPRPFQKEDDARGSLADAIASIPLPRIETGDGVISGIVKTEKGEPLAGVLIRLFRIHPDDRRFMPRKRGAEPPQERDLESQVRDYVAKLKWSLATRQEAVTDASGAYALSGLANADYWILPYREGFEIERVRRGRGSLVRPGENADFVAKVLVEVRVEVFLPDGTLPGEARIEIQKEHSRTWESWSPEDPIIHLNPGKSTVLAKVEGKEEYCSEKMDLTVEAGEPVRTLTFRLGGKAGIRGRVVLPRGVDVDNVLVWALRFEGPRPPDPGELVQDGRQSWCHEHDGYSFSFENLLPGAYLVGASLNRRKIAVSATVEVTDRIAKLDLALPPPDPKEYVVVRAFGPEGRPLAEVEVNTAFRSLRWSSTGGGTAIRQRDGSFLVMHHDRGEREAEDPKSGRWFVTVESKKYGKKELEYTPGKDREIKVHFKDPAHLEVTVAGYAGSAYEGKAVLVLEPRGGVKVRRPPFIHRHPDDEEKGIDSEGKQTLGPMEPGSYDLVLHIRTGRLDSREVSRVPVDLRAGKNQTTIGMPSLYSLTIIVEKAGGHASVQLTPSGASKSFSGRHRDVGKDGKVTFEHLPAGEYKARIWGGPRSGEMVVTVPGPPVVRFEPKQLNAMRVNVEDPEGALARAGFLTGDLVIGIDGVEFQNASHMQALLAVSMTKETTRMLVLRGSARIDIKIDTRRMIGEEDGLGGDFEPVGR